ncbi:6-phosphogluconolactonase [bacterium]|nr:MAG: 6-phosphogluconolactonase [bacterium]
MNIETYPDPTSVASAAVDHLVTTLSNALHTYDSAVWVLAGGSTPNLAYNMIADTRLNTIEWSAVTIVIGDERIGPLDGPDNNWHGIQQILLQHIPQATFLRPRSDRDAESAAVDYEQQLATLPKTAQGYPRFDVVWLGMGEDGHTLSLFPNHASLNPTDTLVIPVHGSPKPPSDRISLSLAGLSGTNECVVLACGEGKQDAIAEVAVGHPLPVGLAAAHIESKGGAVTWLLDKTATPTL